MEPPNVEILPNAALDAAREARAAKLAELEARRIARALIVPADDQEVRRALRSRARPVCLFGEDGHDRRERLRALMAEEKMRGVAHATEEAEEVAGEEEEMVREAKRDAEYYTEGSPELKEMRYAVARPSLQRALARLKVERYVEGIRDKEHPDRMRIRKAEDEVVTAVRASFMVSSQVGDKRPLSAVAIGESPTGSRRIVSTGSWSGDVCVWDGGDSFAQVQTISVHTARISAVSMPRSYPDILLTASADGTAGLHRRGDDDKVSFLTKHSFREHTARVTDAKMHPFRKSLVATCSVDGSFVLHDNGAALLRQESGHSRVYRINFHVDGGLLGTCGLDGGLRIWDIRSGRAVMTMTKAHANEALGIEFSGDGVTVASCGADNLVKLWDLRTRRCAKIIAAHRSLISGMRFGGGVHCSDVLFTASFDKTVKCWGARRNWGLLAAHTSHDDKVTAVDCTSDGKTVVSACYDKTWKVWGDDFS